MTTNIHTRYVPLHPPGFVEEGLIAPEEAWLRAEKQETFEGLCSPAFLKDAQAFN